MRIVLVAVVLFTGSLSLRADVALPTPGPHRLARVDCLVIGRVTAFEDRDVEASMFPKGPKHRFRVAVIAVTDGLLGAKAKDLVRVAVSKPGDRSVSRYPANLEPGQEGLFYLTKHHTESFYFLPMFTDVTSPKSPTYADEVRIGRQAGELLARPLESLKSANAKIRLVTAGLLVFRYRAYQAGEVKMEPIPAEESKLILSAMGEADWTSPPDKQELPNLLMMFNALGLGPKDGWNPEKFKSIEEIQRGARTWLREHRDTYRIQRIVRVDRK